jgi:hypothetical protein
MKNQRFSDGFIEIIALAIVIVSIILFVVFVMV